MVTMVMVTVTVMVMVMVRMHDDDDDDDDDDAYDCGGDDDESDDDDGGEGNFMSERHDRAACRRGTIGLHGSREQTRPRRRTRSLLHRLLMWGLTPLHGKSQPPFFWVAERLLAHAAWGLIQPQRARW